MLSPCVDRAGKSSLFYRLMSGDEMAAMEVRRYDSILSGNNDIFTSATMPIHLLSPDLVQYIISANEQRRGGAAGSRNSVM